MSRDLWINRLEHCEVPHIKTPKYQTMMRRCLMHKVESQLGMQVFQVYFLGGVFASALLVVLMMGLGTDSRTIGQVHAQDLVANTRQLAGSSNSWLNQASQASDLHTVSTAEFYRRLNRRPVALSSATAYAIRGDNLSMMMSPEFRVNVIPAQLINDTATLHGEVTFVQFTTSSGKQTTLGINRQNQLEMVQVDEPDTNFLAAMPVVRE